MVKVPEQSDTCFYIVNEMIILFHAQYFKGVYVGRDERQGQDIPLRPDSKNIFSINIRAGLPPLKIIVHDSFRIHQIYSQLIRRSGADLD